MRKIDDRALWLGNARDLQDVVAIMASGVEAVVELANSERPAALPRSLIHCRYPLSDGGENPEWLVRLTIETIASLLRAEVPVLVCCSAGMSRSVCASAGGIVLAEGRTLARAIALVAREGPVDISPGLLDQVWFALTGPTPPGTASLL